MRCLLKMAAALAALCLALPAQAEELSLRESEGLGLPLREAEKVQEIRELEVNESLLVELDRILEETVADALREQGASLASAYGKKSERLIRSRSFWRRVSIFELALILGAVLGGGFAFAN